MRRMIPVIAILLAASVGIAVAQPGPRPLPAPAWDSRGWVKLGERTVNGRVDRDRIDVSATDKFSKVTMVVEDSDLELIDFRIEFADRTEYHPKVTQFFREGQRTRVIDLPPAESIIRAIDIQYRNLPGGGRARVQVWGWRIGGVVPPPPPPPPSPPIIKHSWDTRGWTLLGSRQVNGRMDRDRIEVGRDQGRFNKLTMAVEDSELELLEFKVEFEDGTNYRPQLAYTFREGQRTRAIDLPPSERAIRYIDIKYKNTRGGGPASVEIWGFRTGGGGPGGPGGPGPGPGPGWDSRGWTMLGEQRVDGRRTDTDRIGVSSWEPRFRQLTVVVLDSDLELRDLSIKFDRGAPFHPNVAQVFRENTRTRVIDLPGDRRAIKWIEFKYRNLPGGGPARVQVWAK